MSAHRPLRVGLAGAGMISAHHLKAWARVPGAAIVAIADPEIARARDRADRHGVDGVHGSVAEMLAAERLDALDIATPLETHCPLVSAAVARGLAALCQKPLAASRAEAEELRVRIGPTARVMVHENWRFRSPYRAVAGWIAAGHVGAVRQARLAYRSAGLLPGIDGVRPALARQPFLARIERLAIGEVLIHHLDVMRWLIGPVRVVACRTARAVTAVAGESAATIALESGTGALATVEGNLAAVGVGPGAEETLSLDGDDGSVRFDGRRLTLVSRHSSEALSFEADAVYQSAFDGAIGHFAECLRNDAPFETDIGDNLETLKLVDDSYAAERKSRDPEQRR
jgi:D-apiose dehydrogenase